jgi:SAM-dependent methyltransferase
MRGPGEDREMSLADDYRRQFAWRGWPTLLESLPSLEGANVVDLGCGVGDLSAALAARGASVVGIDLNEELLREAMARRIPNAAFRRADLREPLELDAGFDGLWCGFVAAYFPDLASALTRWKVHLRPGGWIALTEIDDLFGHEPLPARTKALLQGYADDALVAGRYDFRMGRKLREHLERAGFAVVSALILPDRELAFDGPAEGAVIEAWAARLDRMKLLETWCGAEFPRVRGEFLECLAGRDHRSSARVHACLATA